MGPGPRAKGLGPHHIHESQQRGEVVFKNTNGATVCTFDDAISLDSMEGVIPVEFRAQEFKPG
jgi:hypothetical protein